ncbi:hypothetical protein BKD26_29970 [Streptomyces sp. CB03238]|nr:hypothetical protein BKD26_29970 [Streptomyces sp. CB03238]
MTQRFGAYPVGKSATLHNDSQCIELHYSSSVLEDFLMAMSRIQAEFDRRSQALEPVAVHGGEFPGQRCHV